MSNLTEKVGIVAKVAGTAIKGILGDDVEFILIPVVDTGEEIEIAVISSLTPPKTCALMAMAAIKTIDAHDPQKASEVKEKLKGKMPSTQFH